MASGWFTNGLMKCLDGTIDLDAATLKVILLGTATTYTYDPDTTVVDAGGANDIVDSEITGVSGYTRGWGGAGRKTATVTLDADDTNDRVRIAIADLTWTALGAGDTIAAAVLIKEGGANDTTSVPIAYFDVTDTPTNGSDITLDFAALSAPGNLTVTMGSGLYQNGWLKILNGTIDLDTTTLKVLLVSTATTYTYNADNTFVDVGGANDVIDAESNVTNYTRGWGGAGRKTATVSLSADNTNNRVVVTFTDLTWTSLGGASNQTLDAALLVKEGGANDTTSDLLAYWNLTNTLTNGGNVTLDFATSGAGGNIQVNV